MRNIILVSNIEQKILDNKTTTNSYADSIVVNLLAWSKAGIWINNNGGSNSIDYKVLGRYSVGDGDAGWKEKVAETALGAETATDVQITESYALVKVQIKATTPDSQSTVDAFCVKKRN
jgi:hypothetical protein